MAQRIIPARLTQETADRINSLGLSTSALARLFHTTPQVLQAGLEGRPTVTLLAGIARAFEVNLNQVAEFQIGYPRKKEPAA